MLNNELAALGSAGFGQLPPAVPHVVQQVNPPVSQWSMPHQNDIMIVDDNPANLKLLEDMLRQRGHEVCSFPRGRLALARAARNPPDLILLDINMPEMNGYEVCERLKSIEGVAGIPVIFLSALSETQDKVKAFQSGAVDYISKPFQFEEVHARVETHLKLHHLQRELKLHNERLEEAVAARTRELAEANVRLTILDRSKNQFLKLISHELRTPLNGLLGVAEIFMDGMPSTEPNNELREVFEHSRRRLLSMSENALLLTEIDIGGERLRSSRTALHAVLSRAIEKTTEFAELNHVALSPPRERPDFDVVRGDGDLLVRALQALLETAVRFSDRGETVRLTYESAPDSPRVIIESVGKTIPDRVLPNLFDLFSVDESSTPGRDLGLAPAVAYRILSLYGASVEVANREPPGIRLTISFRRPAGDTLS
jgi:two-component system sensor histidine kinase/response regulator